jgi:hypothetical protein
MAQNPTSTPPVTPSEGPILFPRLPATAEPGWTTTEFWATLLSMFVGLLTTLGVIHVNIGDPAVANEVQVIAGLLALVVPAVAYAIGRSIRKSGTQG